MQTLEKTLEQAVTLHQQGKLNEAEAIYNEILKVSPTHADAFHLLGMVAANRKDYLTAIRHIRRAIELDPTAAMYYNNLGGCLGALLKREEEERCYRKALELNPGYTDPYTNLKQLLESQGRKQDAAQLEKDFRAEADKIMYADYQRYVDATRKSVYMEYPMHVHMETMAKCNAACVFCPYPKLERQGTVMPDALIHKIIKDLADIPKHVRFQLSPFKVNEPFLDVRLFDVLQEINDTLPNAWMTLTTNATPVTEKNLMALTKIKNLDSMWISFNDHREKEYEETMSLPYKRTIERLELIHRKRVSGELPFRVVLSRVGDGTDADIEFINWVRNHFPHFEQSVLKRGSWIGQVDIDQNVPDVGCTRWFELSITATGTVAHCCMDGQAKWPIGDVNTRHVLEVYNDPHYRALREKTRSRREASPCNQCAFM